MATLAGKPDPTELVILAVLADGPLYGYAIAKKVAATSSDGIRLGPGILYPALGELERLGLIRAEWETVVSDRSRPGNSEEEARGRRRKWYSLTAKGRRRLEQSVLAHRRHQALIDLFIAGLDGGSGPREVPR